MPVASLRFYAELNDFLPPARAQTDVTCAFAERTTVKDLIERFGVPHTEVDLVLVNGDSVPFSHQVEEGDRVSVFPVFESLDIAEATRVRPRPLRELRFVLDAHLGKLAAYLRLLGFDSLYRNDFDDRTLAGVSAAERRILLTRDRGLLKRSQVDHGYCVRAVQPPEQVVEVVRRFQLSGLVEPFSRCLRCNALLRRVDGEALPQRVPSRVRAAYEEFKTCDECGRVYWKGTHYERLDALVRGLLEEAGS